MRAHLTGSRANYSQRMNAVPPKKILYCASTASHLENFHKPYFKALSDLGCEVYTAAEKEFLFYNTAGCFVLPFKKSFLSPDNLKAVFMARSLLLKKRFDTIPFGLYATNSLFI